MGHLSEFLVGMGICSSCGNNGHKVRYFSNFKGQEKIGKRSGCSDALKKNRFYALHSRSEQETSIDLVTVMLKIFTLDVYALLYPGATLSFVTPLVAKMFDTLPDIL